MFLKKVIKSMFNISMFLILFILVNAKKMLLPIEDLN